MLKTGFKGKDGSSECVGRFHLEVPKTNQKHNTFKNDVVQGGGDAHVMKSTNTPEQTQTPQTHPKHTPHIKTKQPKHYLNSPMLQNSGGGRELAESKHGTARQKQIKTLLRARVWRCVQTLMPGIKLQQFSKKSLRIALKYGKCCLS